MARSSWAVCFGAAVLAACTGTIADRPDTAGAAPGASAPGGGSRPSGAAGSGGAGTTTPAACANVADRPGPAPARRLTRTEYANTVRDLFAGITLPTIELPPDESVDGFDNNVTAQGETPALLEAHVGAAKAIASALPDPVAFLKCDASASAACVAKFLDDFGLRALRRPLAADEKSRYADFFTANAAKYGAPTSARMLVQALLLAPSFLYRVDRGTPVAGRSGVAALTGYEIASRLSYLLWQSLPDKALFDAAASGELTDAAGVERHARRLLGDPRAASAVASFQAQWLELDRVARATHDPKLFPAWKPTMSQTLADATARFVDDNFWRGDGTVAGLLTSRRAFVDGDVAKLYGVNAPGSAGMSAVELDGRQRAGILTQAGVLAGLAHVTADAPILRGVFVLRRLMCAPPPAPPPGIMDTAPPAGAQPMTTRQHYEQTHAGASCRACHAQIDPIGFLFERYDATGQLRTKENGVDVDSRATLATGTELDGPYDDVVQLAPKLAASDQVATCAARHAFRFALGRSDGDDDACTIAHAMTASRGNLKELFVKLATSDAFRFRLEDAP